MTVYGQLVGQLLLRTIDRAQRIHQAMCCRGFSGEIHLLRSFSFGIREIFFTFGWCTVFIFLRAGNVSQVLGKVLLELVR